MELRQLRHFVAVMEHRNLSQAAEHVFISQPALTRSIRNLEEELGVELLERLPRGVAPTPAGEAFHDRARLILNECRRAHEVAHELSDGLSGTLDIGVGALFAAHLVDEAVHRMTRAHPGLRLRVIEGFYEELVDRLLAGDLDILFLNVPAVAVPTGLIVEPLYEVASVVVAGATHPLAGAASVSVGQLAEADWIEVNQPHARDFLDQLFAAHGLRAQTIPVRTNSLALIRALARRGEALAALPRHVVAEDIASGRLVELPVPGTPLRRHAGLIRRDSPIPQAARDGFCDTIRAICEKIDPQI